MNSNQQNTQLIRKFLDVRPASSPTFSCDGKHISFIMNLVACHKFGRSHINRVVKKYFGHNKPVSAKNVFKDFGLPLLKALR